MSVILVVDDQASNRDVLTTLLGYCGHRMIEAADGAEGLVVAAREQPDLIISDVLMPTMDGYEFVRRLRDDPALASKPVCFIPPITWSGRPSRWRKNVALLTFSRNRASRRWCWRW